MDGQIERLYGVKVNEGKNFVATVTVLNWFLIPNSGSILVQEAAAQLDRAAISSMN